MKKKNLSKLLALYLPYVVIGLLTTNLGEAWRLAVGKELGDKIVSLMGTLPVAFANPLPSLHPFDLFIGLCCGAGMRLAVYLKSKNSKKYRHGMEYGSARWGGPKDIEPFMAPKFEDNIILTKTERLMMSNRPPDPKNARNKNVLVVGGSGSGKTRFFIKPNLLQCDSKDFPVSFVVTDPKGSIGVECGEALLKHGYKLKFFNTINFSKSMRYNPMAYMIAVICSLGQAPIRTHPFSSGRQSSTSSSRKSVLDGIMILRSSSMFRWRSLKNLRVIRSRCVLRVGGKRTLNKHPLGGWVLRMEESSFLTKLLVKL